MVQPLEMPCVPSLSHLKLWGARLSSHVRLKTAPTTEPVSLSDLKLYLRIDNNEEDSLLTMMIASARQMAEEYTLRSFITQTWTLWLDRLPLSKSNNWWDGVKDGHIREFLGGGSEIIVPRPPLISVTHVKSYNDGDTATTFSSSNYIVDTAAQPGRIVLKNGSVWPTDIRVANGIEVEFVSGYGSQSSVPSQIKMAIMMIAGHLYENRGDEELFSMPAAAERILSKYQVRTIGHMNFEG